MLALNVTFWVAWATSPSPGNDFEIFYEGARVAWSHGSAAVYDTAVMTAAVRQLPGNQGQILPSCLPFQFWAVTPIAWLPYWTAYWVWTVVSLAAAVLAWWLVAAGTVWERAIQLLALLSIFPTAFELVLGQFTFLTAVALAAPIAWRGARREGAAGAVLSALVFKPQTGGLAVVTLAVGGRRRLFAVWAAVTLALLALAAASLGKAGVLGYLHVAAQVQQMAYFRRLTLVGRLPGPGAEFAGAAVVAILTCAAAWRLRDRGSELLVPLGIVGSLLATPYLNLQDLALLVVGGWMLLRLSRRPGLIAAMLASYAVVELVNVIGPIPLLLMEGAWFLWLLGGAPGLGEPAPL